MGEPSETVWQCPLAMDKWNKLVIGPKQTGLGLIIDTSRLTTAIINSPLGINSLWISTNDNRIADNISHFKK